MLIKGLKEHKIISKNFENYRNTKLIKKSVDEILKILKEIKLAMDSLISIRLLKKKINKINYYHI